MKTRSYGRSGPLVIVLHGGPGAAGYMAPVARELAGSFRVLEPFQRRRGAERLTVARHVEDLGALVASLGGERPFLLGSSWGAMLALAYAAQQPQSVASLVLVGCGTFDAVSRQRFRQQLAALLADAPAPPAALRAAADPDDRFRAMAERLLPYYSHDLLTVDQELAEVDARGGMETWMDMVRQQERGLYPAAFAAIDAPVLMLHGAADPHPGGMIRDSLRPYLPQLEYVEWDRCGHYPWMERYAREGFFATSKAWLRAHAARPVSPVPHP